MEPTVAFGAVVAIIHLENKNEQVVVAEERSVFDKINEGLSGIRLALNCVILGLLAAELVVGFVRRGDEKNAE